MAAAVPPQVRGATHAETPFRVCGAATKSGGRCKLHTIKWGEQCWIHTIANDHLKIKHSQVPGAGDGLFAWDPKMAAVRRPVFHSGARIDSYTGEISTEAALDRKYGADTTFEYAVKGSDGKIVNAWKKNYEATRYANDPRNNLLLNAEFRGTSRTLALWATRDIYHDEEIFVDYSEDFWHHGEPSRLASAARSASRPAVPPVPARLPPVPSGPKEEDPGGHAPTPPSSPPRPPARRQTLFDAPEKSPPRTRRLTLAPGEVLGHHTDRPRLEAQNDHALWFTRDGHTWKFERDTDEAEKAREIHAAHGAETIFAGVISAHAFPWRHPELEPVLNEWGIYRDISKVFIADGFSLIQYRSKLSFFFGAKPFVSARYTESFYREHPDAVPILRQVALVLAAVHHPEKGYAALRYFYPAMLMETARGKIALADFHNVVWRSTIADATKTTLDAMYLDDE